MIYFLTSSPTGSLDGKKITIGFDQDNQFVENLKKYWKNEARCLMIAASPHAYQANDEMIEYFHDAINKSDLGCSCLDLLDKRYQICEEELLQYDVIILAGGHVPTQNAYFHEIELKKMIQLYQGIIIGISAGSMNCASDVYAIPEEEGEAISSCYQRDLLGLGISDIRIIPHFQMLINMKVDGLKMIDDLACKDSYQYPLLALEDGSYLMGINNHEYVYGNAYWIINGNIEQFNYEDEMKCIK